MAASQQSHLGPTGLLNDDAPSATSSVSNTISGDAGSVAASLARRNDESWVEIASQPSSSSLSSIGDDIVTTGLRVGTHSHPPRRRRLQDHYHQSLQQQQQHQMPQSYIVSNAAAQSATSSQDEYDETESEEDHVITSSTENIAPTQPFHDAAGLRRSQTAIGPGAHVLLSDSDDDDDDGTALGRPSPAQSFRPRPNAFSHPPAHLSQRSYSTNAAIPPTQPAHNHPFDRPSWTSHRSHNRPRPDFRNPSYQADHDEVLRASLTTLLSCAAAAKSLPGRRANIAGSPCSGEPMIGTGLGPSPQPMELRLVPESELNNGASPLMGPGVSKQHPHQPVTRQPTIRTSSNSSAQSQPASVSSREEMSKRPAATGQAKTQRAAKKKRTSVSTVDANTVTWISPATLTWVLGTGVVLLVSVVGFGAGFVVGREIGRQDILSSTSGTGSISAGMNSSCGSEVIRSTGTGTLKRWRWGTGMARSVIA